MKGGSDMPNTSPPAPTVFANGPIPDSFGSPAVPNDSGHMKLQSSLMVVALLSGLDVYCFDNPPVHPYLKPLFLFFILL